MAKSDWREVDVAELSEQLRDRYSNMKAIYRRYADAKAEFENEMQKSFSAHLEDDEELKFGYNFGKLSIAVGEKRERKPRKAQDKPSLSEWLRARQENGDRS